MSYKSLLLETSPTLYYSFDSGVDEEWPADESGNGNDPDSVLAEWLVRFVADARFGTVVTFDGNQCQPRWDGPLWGDPDAWTVQFFARSPGPLGFASITGFHATTGTERNMRHTVASGDVTTSSATVRDENYVWWGTSGNVGESAAPWRMLTSRWDGTTLEWYVNGALVRSDVPSAPLREIARGPEMWFNGPMHVAHLSIHDGVALSPSKIAELYASTLVWPQAPVYGDSIEVSSPPVQFVAPPPMPTAYLWDDFDRPDGPLGTALTGRPWATPGASWVIDSGSARPEIDALNPIAFLSLPGAQVESAEVTVTIPPGWDSFSSAELGVGAEEASEEGHVVIVKGNGEVWGGERTVWGGGWEAHPRLGVVDVSPGPHTFTVTRAPGPDGDMWIAVWWDGLLVAHRQASTHLGNQPSGPGVLLYSDRQNVLFDDLKVALGPVRMPFSVEPPLARTGVRSWPYPADVLYMPFTDAPSIDTLGLAPDLALSPHLTGPIFAPFTDAPPLHGGVHSMWSDTPAEFIPEDPDSWPPGVQYGRPTAAAAVSGFPFRTVQQCQPQLNAPGSGSFTCVPPGPGLGSLIRYTAGGGVVFTGRADTVETVVAASGEESQQLVTVTTPGAIEPDWTQTVVFPDMGAFEPDDVGQPAQDDRTFGFPMVGLEVPGLTWEASAPGDREKLATEDEKLPIPDAWPDFTSEYMWVTDPDVDAQPPGWCFFRKEVATWPGEYALFVNSQGAWSRVWVDGAPVMTIEKPGETKRVDLPFGWGGSHLIAIESFAQGGVPAAINLTMMMRHASGFGFLAAQSGVGWECLPYPTISMRAPVGKVLRRLLSEASARGAPAGRWAAGFSDLADSNGRSWPTGDDAPLITIRVGSTYMDVLNQLTEALIDWHASPSGSTLMAYVKDSAIGSASLPWTLGVDAEAWTNRVSGS